MLAQEAHRRLSTQLGAEQVGLVTGEERVNEDAPIVCCTAEMAPQRGEVLVLDEIQWADDEERGSAWTRLLLAGEYRHILLLGAVEALPLVQQRLPGGGTPLLRAEGAARLDRPGRVPEPAAGHRGRRVQPPGGARARGRAEPPLRRPRAVLYGAMPLGSRRLEIDRFLTGGADFCAATDVLGHGVNLPCETLLFAETTKFDGQERRELHPWEIAQIAGRAGRFGLVERGHVGVLTGSRGRMPTPSSSSRRSSRTSSCPAATTATASSTPRGSGRGSRICRCSRLRSSPRRSRAWHTAALRQWATEGWLSVESIGPCSAGSTPCSAGCATGAARSALGGDWKLVNAPVDEDNARAARDLALAVAGDRSQRPMLDWLLDTKRLRDASLEDAEQAARTASILRWFALQYPGVAGVTIERAAALEQAAAERVSARLAAEVRSPTVGRCRSCGRSCAPWFALCDRCYTGRR